MVARITFGKSFSGLVYYNEHKVNEGQAICIEAVGYGQPAAELTNREKVIRLQKQARKNRMANTNVVHISLNFEPSEQLNQDQLSGIAASYMEKLGFGNQPYLVYRHFDASHPHIHIVTTNIQDNGDRIPTHMIGATIGMAAREMVEDEFGLVKARGRAFNYEIAPADLDKVQYGKRPVKAEISRIVRAVIGKYHFGSLAELNAVLKDLNVVADPGTEGSTLHSRDGLVYSIIDETGNRFGSAIKASSIYIDARKGFHDRPTMKLLRQKFQTSHVIRKKHRARLATVLNDVLGVGVTLGEFRDILALQNIAAVVHHSRLGAISGFTFYDKRTGVVFKGSDLAKNLSAAGITARLIGDDERTISESRRITEDVAARTDYSAGIRSVLNYWKGQGLAIEVRRVNNEHLFFYWGARGNDSQYFVPVPRLIENYFRANLFHITHTNEAGQHRQPSFSPATHQPATEHTFIHQNPLVSGLFMVRELWDELLTAETTSGATPFELLEEARRKRRRKRRH